MSLKLKDIFFEEISAAARKEIETIDPSDTITVYHGTPLFRIGDLINGFDATTPHRRDYRAGEHPGLFITADFETAKSFGGGAVLELQVPAKFIHGVDYGGNIGREQEKAGIDLDWMKRKYPESFRPYMSYTMLNTAEPQGLLRGVVKPSQIKKIFKRNLDTKNWDEYTREEFLDANMPINRDISGKEVFVKDVGIDLSDPKMSIDDFVKAVAEFQGYSEDKIWPVFLRRAEKFPEKLKEMLEDWKFGESRLGARAVENLYKQFIDRAESSTNESKIPSLSEAYFKEGSAGKFSSLIKNPEEVSYKQAMNELKWTTDGITYGMVAPRDPEEMKWYYGDIDISKVRVSALRPKKAGDYAKTFKQSMEEGIIPPIFVEITWQGDDLDGDFSSEIIDGNHRAMAAKQAGISHIHGYLGIPEWASLEEVLGEEVIKEETSSFRLPQEILDGTGNDYEEDGILVKNIPIKAITMLKQQGEGMVADIQRGELSRTEGSPILWYDLDKQQLIIDDGNHRIFQQWLQGKDTIDAIVYSSDYHNYLRSVYEDEEKFNWDESYRTIDEEFIGKKGGLSYFQMGGSLSGPLYNQDKKGKATKDPGVAGLKRKK
jgi:hypothetical protein